MEGYIGQIVLFCGDFIPSGWVRCDGSAMSTTDNQLLYSVIKNKFGGDSKTFYLPKIADEANGPFHLICIYGVYVE